MNPINLPTRLLALIFILSLSYLHAKASKKNKPKEAYDSTLVYRKIETFSSKHPTTKYLHGLVLTPINPTTQKKSTFQRSDLNKSYTEYEGKIIRNIKIATLDPFGTSLTDTANTSPNTSPNIILQAGNKVHIKTMRITVHNLLLFKKNQPLDPLRVKESERLIRSQGFVHDVDITIEPTSATADSVDIFIRELDLWSLSPRVYLASSSAKVKITEKNFIGTGHELYFDYARHYQNKANAYQSKYYIPSIRNSYINCTLLHQLDQYKNYDYSANLERPFYSALARWAGGVEYLMHLKSDSLLYEPTASYVPLNTKYNSMDYWGGASFQLFNGRSEFYRTTKFITTLRYLHINYRQKPLPLYDPEQIMSDADFILASIGISSRQYVQTRYLLNFGVIEDIPVGLVASLTGGYQYKNHTERLYTGARFAYGKVFSWGLLSTNLEYGAYIRAQIPEQSVVKAELNYFTNLFVVGKWRFRQFVRPQGVFGINRFSTESINLNGEDGIRGFDSPSVTGTKKLLLTLQTQSYAPWKLIGFRFGPYLTTTLGMIGDSENGFKNRRVYSQFGVGCLIKNEFLIINTFQISLAYYPTIPGQGDKYIKLNPTNTTDYTFTNYQLGKPTIVDYK